MRELDEYGDWVLAEWLRSDDAYQEGVVQRLRSLLDKIEAERPLTERWAYDISTPSPHDLLVWLGEGGPVVTIRLYSDEDPENMFSIVRIGPDEGYLPMV